MRSVVHELISIVGSGLTACLLAAFAPGAARGDSVEVDVTKTHADQLNRYCFRVTNDDNDEPDSLHAEKIASFYVRVQEGHQWRDNVADPGGWDHTDSRTSLGVDPQKEGAWVHWETSDDTKRIAPGDQEDGFCFVVRDTVKIVETYTDYQSVMSQDPVKLADMPAPNKGMVTDDSNDTDFMTDTDGDGIPDKFDKHPEDPDADGDTKDDAHDNCTEAPNPGQEDGDADGLGDACDPDPANPDTDGDGLEDGLEVHVMGTSPLLPDSDGDGVPDNVEFDLGSDPNNALSIPEVPGNGIDDDGFGVIDENTDVDGDTIDFLEDNCPDVFNPDQADGDGNGIGNACQQQLPALPGAGSVVLSLALAALGAEGIRRRPPTC